ncbi:MAG: nitrous oxide reductase family maturation protein NosD [Planctomycetota bacterium JB042]
MNRIVLPLVLLSAGVLAERADGAKRKVPQQYPTLQAAIAAAAPHDVVVVGAGTYTESLWIQDVADVRIRGKKGAVLDGGGGPAAITLLNCQRVTVEGLTIRNADVGIATQFVQGSTVDDCRFLDVADVAIELFLAAACRVVDSRVTDVSGGGVRIEQSTGCVVERTRFLGVEDDAVTVSGSMHSILDNRFVDCGHIGIRVGDSGVPGESTLVAGNVLTACGSESIQVRVGSTGVTVLSNRIRKAKDDAIHAGDSVEWVVIAANVVKKASGSGILFHADESIVRKNRIVKAGGDGILVGASTHQTQFEANRVRKCANDGFLVDASGNSFVGNRARKNAAFDLHDLSGPAANAYIDNVFGTTH